ncbi:tRNA pseudouridine(55) synthase TruB [Sphingosinicella sp. YJ22]|uniref:tRNA pseudouridine(55) synthase TruB n=1 Tax=Sphingosinicella sp. YJ22 TaxID=1104780 RepID=UPI00140CF5FC|nr:tRNA pseudouridine(55) synthase TruB [Sphingosinicella sp. YJ22]
MHGWLIIDKPVGPGSTQIVGAVKRALREGGYAKVKVGHGGTLDPLASGVLPVALGEATKLSGRMLDADKAYHFTIRFGEETDTLDAEGKVVATSKRRPTLTEVEAVLPRFTGPIEQLPPAFSALKVDGKRAYDLARAGEVVKLATRRVTVHDLKILPGTGRWFAEGETEGAPGPARAEGPLHHPSGGPPPRTGEELEDVTLSARVSKGTYIRSLARDIAHALNSVGHVTMLRRTKAGPFTLEKAISLDKLADLAKARRLEEALLPLAAGLDDIPALTVTPREADLLRVGQQPTGSAARPGLHLALLDDVPVALVECSEGVLRVVRGFNL